MAQGNYTKGINRKGSRKTLYRDEMMHEAYKLGALGLTFEELCVFWNVGHATLIRYCHKYPQLKQQIVKGRKESDLTVIQSVLDQARKGNMTAAIFWLKNRCGWRDAYGMEHSGKVEGLADKKVYIQVIHNNGKTENAGVRT